jgi:hypothetical protein
MQRAILATTGEVFYLFELNFSGGTLRFTTTGHDLSWSGQTWTALGGHLSFDGVQEQSSLRGQSVPITLDGVNQTVISALLGGSYIGRTAKIYVGHIVGEDNEVLYSEDFSQWTEINTCTLTSGQTDPFGGTAAYTLADADGAQFTARRTSFTPTVPQFVVGIWMKYGNHANPGLWISRAAGSASITATFVASGVLNSVAYSASGGLSCTEYAKPEPYPGDWYLVRALVDTIATDIHYCQARPCAAAAADTGNARFFGGHVAFGPECKAYSSTNGAAAAGGTIIDAPYMLFSGYMNSSFNITETPNDTCRVRTTLAPRLTRFNQRRGLRADLAVHQHHFSGDTFWRHIAALGNKTIWWGLHPLRADVGPGWDDEDGHGEDDDWGR